MQQHYFAPRRTRVLSLILALACLAAPCLMTSRANAQAGVSPDPQTRATQQWEDVLLLEDFDYMQLTPQQCKDMQALADYARSRLDEVEQQRIRLQKVVQEQHQALLKGQHPSESDQIDVLQKQRQIADRQELVAKEIVDRLAPKLGGILTRKQTVRAWILMQNKIPQSGPKRSALTDVASGFVLPQMEGHDAIEEMVKTALRATYPPDVVEQALTPWEFASLAGLVGGGGLGVPGGGGPGAGPGGQVNPAKAIQAIQEMDPRMGQRMLMLGQRMIKQFTGASDSGAPPTPPVAPEMRAAINKDAVALRKRIETDPEGFMSQAKSEQMLEALRPLARRLFLSPQVKDALTAREHIQK